MTNTMNRRRFLELIGSIALCTHGVRALANTERLTDDIVILIPGIMGSILKRGSDVVWGPNADAVWQVLKSGNLDLEFLRPSLSETTTSSSVKATGLFESTTLIPGFWKLDGYTETRKVLIEQLGLTLGQNYFEFPYDWRLNNRIAAQNLIEMMSEKLSFWRDHIKRSDAKIVLIAHSMGGLIARYACEVLGGWSTVREVFSLGTPYQGSVKALDRIANGMVSAGLTKTLSTFDSVYQLMPTYQCIDSGGGVLVSMDSMHSQLADMIDMKRYIEVGKGFHDECDAAAKKNKTKGVNGLLHITQSSTHKTLCSTRFDGHNLISSDRFGEKVGGGDGTVPGFQFARPKLTPASISYFHCDQLHGSIQIDKSALINLAYTLRSEFPSGSRQNLESLSIRVTEFTRLGDPVRVELSLGFPQEGKIPLRIIDVVSGNIVLEKLVGQTEKWQTHTEEFSATHVGIYRVVFGIENTNPYCRDITCVAAPVS